MADSDHLKTQSGALIGSNDDVLIEILLRLPVTSVLRFRSISKHWRSILSHPPFTVLYKNAFISPGFFVLNFYFPFDVEDKSAPPFSNFDFYPDPCGIRIVQSCNGLLLCCSKGALVADRKYAVLNPTTRQIALIPSVPGGRDVRKTMRFMGLAFHPTDRAHYKVVSFHRTTNYDLFHYQIYSSDTGKWRKSDESFSFHVPYHAFLSYGVYWNDAIHWNPFDVTPSYFKVDSEELGTLPLPVRKEALPLYFGVSRGHLHLVVASDESHLQLNVYEMLKDYSGWVLKYRVELHELFNSYPEIHSIYDGIQVLDVVRGEEDDESFIMIGIPGNQIITYIVANKNFRHIYNLGTFNDGGINRSEVHRYIETLVCF